uniref:gamma-glutamylcyclotransferase n=1 Tax=Xenopsylla cheopis TaxID=163159 RepID=A0A6M2DP07_XENCH
MPNPNTFLYFAYGSNLLAKRIHINNPTAVRKDIGKLLDYCLDFNKYSDKWGGASATVVPKVGEHVWGAIWEIENKNLASLDKQEGVHLNSYQAKDINIKTKSGKNVLCRIYEQCKLPPTLQPGEPFPEDRKPSLVYLETIIQGALESGLPDTYLKMLRSIPHNGNIGDEAFRKELGILLSHKV